MKTFVRLTPIDPDKFPVALRTIREQRGLSLRELSFPGCTAGYLSRLENGTRIPSLQMSLVLADRLGVAPARLGIQVEDDALALLRLWRKNVGKSGPSKNLIRRTDALLRRHDA